MEQKKKKYDMNTPEARRLADEIVHGTFMKEGTMVAFPTCFPGASVPIPAEESRITALDITPDGIVYGGTSGYQTHVFVAMLHGVTGVVFDLKAVAGATSCAAVCCGREKFLACVNGPSDGGRILAAKLQPLPFDLIQEWGFERPGFEDCGEAVPGEPILHAVADGASDLALGITGKHVFTVDFGSSRVEVVGEAAGSGRLAVGSRGGILGQDGAGSLWRFDPKMQKLERKAFALPPGAWEKNPVAWSRGKPSCPLYAADGEGRLFAFNEDKGFSGPLGQTPLSPVGPMAVTFDGRLFGFCGRDLAKMFCYDPASNAISNLGVAVSVLERRRYGYVFGDALTGRDGEIYFGENDNLGHLWVYFPKIRPSA